MTMRVVLQAVRLAGLCAALMATNAEAQVAQLQVDPKQVTLSVGQRFEVLATALDRSNNVLLGVEFRWTSQQPAVVAIEAEPDGIAKLVGLTPGSAQVEVAVGSRTATISVEVQGLTYAGPIGEGTPTRIEIEPATALLLPSEDVRLLPRFLKDDGTPAAPVPLSWHSFRPDVASIDQSGMLVGIQEGTGLVEATSESGLRQRVQVQVGVVPWSFGVPVVSLAPAESDTLELRVPRQGNRLLDPKWVSWSSANRDVVTVSAGGVVTAISAGRTNVTGFGFGQEASVEVRVHQEVDGFTVAAIGGDTILLPVGGTAGFRVVPVAADDTPIPDAPITWIVGDPTVASYQATDSVARGLKVGVTTLEARYRSETVRSWTLNVVPARVMIEDRRIALSFGSSRQVRAWFTNDVGERVAPAEGLQWSTANAAVLGVSGDGTIQGVEFGGTQLIAGSAWGRGDTVPAFVVGDLMFTSMRTGSADVFAASLSEPGIAGQLTAETSAELEAAYSPDGTRFAFASDRGGQFDLFVADADGSNLQRVTDSPESEHLPAWTPDGQRLVYESDLSGSAQIWIVDVTGANATALTAGDRDNRHPAVSPDGRMIAMTSFRDGNAEVYLMGIDGSNQRNITASRLEEFMPKWIDEQTVAFLRGERRHLTERVEIVSLGLRQGEERILSPPRPVLAFDVRPGGDLLAVILSLAGPSGDHVRRLFVLPPEGTDGVAVEISLADGLDQLAYPAFRR